MKASVACQMVLLRPMRRPDLRRHHRYGYDPGPHAAQRPEHGYLPGWTQSKRVESIRCDGARSGS
jgi:hypothetical protein